MVRCPICRAKYKGTPQCHRCQSDLSVLLELIEQAIFFEKQAVLALASGNLTMAQQASKKAETIYSTPFSKTLSRFCLTLISTKGNNEA
jgi:hypothetical protein